MTDVGEGKFYKEIREKEQPLDAVINEDHDETPIYAVYSDDLKKLLDAAKQEFQSCIIGVTNVTQNDVIFVEQTWQINERMFKQIFEKWFGSAEVKHE